MRREIRNAIETTAQLEQDAEITQLEQELDALLEEANRIREAVRTHQ
ncbi:MAG: hypothetical protein LBL49_03290 [Clostridiales Family XIII bacterium]|nr:hypothetical protein [Clostridiales Family XIII bacterium]